MILYAVISTQRQREFGERVAEIRRDQGLTQAELAERAGTSQSGMSQLEAGLRNPSYEMIVKIAAGLRVTPCYLFASQPVDLNPEEERLFRKWRGLSTEARREVEGFVDYLGSKTQRPGVQGE